MAQIKMYAAAAIVALATAAVPLAARQDPAPKPAPTQEPAQKPKSVSDRAETTATFTIEAIDYKSREVVLKDKDGHLNTVVAGPQIQRFNELKVGEKVTFHYYEAMVYSIRPSGAAAPTSGSSMVTDKGPKPAGTYTKQQTASVVVTALDTSVSSLTVKTDDGKTMSFKVKDKKNLEGVHVGDRVDIVYSQALAVKVE
jgi:Cu/Ag efflux protein CusF